MAEGDHYIEESVQVYLRWEGGRWVSDTPVGMGELESVIAGGARNEACECGSPDECREVVRRANDVPLPDAAELAALLCEALAAGEAKSR